MRPYLIAFKDSPVSIPPRQVWRGSYRGSLLKHAMVLDPASAAIGMPRRVTPHCVQTVEVASTSGSGDCDLEAAFLDAGLSAS
jgi:hypothetical protein